MELFFTEGEQRRPFILDAEMRWMVSVNHFLREVSVVSGKTVSPLTWRAYAYHLLDFLNFCEKIGRGWSEILEMHLSEYRNALSATPSPLTKRYLTRETINGRLGTACLFYKFALRKRYIEQLPFSLEEVRISRNRDEDMIAHIRNNSGKAEVNRLMLRTYDGEIEIPPNREVRRFIEAFGSWRDKLIAEAMWFVGMRRAEACSLTIHALPEDVLSLTNRTHKIRIQGKGGKWRSVYFPVSLLRSIARYTELERNPRVLRYKVKTEQIWVSDVGQPIRPATIDKAFAMNAGRCGVRITPHNLRHSYATNRLIYLEDHNVPSPYKIVQAELGHAHLATTLRYIRYVGKIRAEVIATQGHFIDQLISDDENNEEE